VVNQVGKLILSVLPFPKREKVEVIIRQAQDSDDNEAWMQ
jgi:hypothetical protein